MSGLLLFWIGAAVLFIIVELLTAAFYGLALALASSLVIVYILVTQDTSIEISHAVIFVIGSFGFSYFLPKLLQSKTQDIPQGADRYKGIKRTAKKVGGDLKISLDGVDYPIVSDGEIAAGDKVEVIDHTGVTMKVKKSA